MTRYVNGVWSRLGRLLGADEGVRRLQQKLAEEQQKVEKLRKKNRRLMARGRSGGKARGGQDGRRLAFGNVHFGDFRSLEPISREFGMDRGRPIDRYYIEGFLARHAEDIGGRVLEINDSAYTRKYGGERVTKREVLDLDETNKRATIVADLTRAEDVPSDAFDCIICTQTLHFIYDISAAFRTLRRILKPGGILLATFPGIGQTSCQKLNERYCWALTTLATRRLCEEVFADVNVEIEAYGNVLAAVAFLEGLAVRELRKEELDHHDPDYELLISLRAIKPEVGL
jgi:SAM-dependent methyltransferase